MEDSICEMANRSAGEIFLRIQQEAGNLTQLIWKPRLGSSVDVPRLDLPDAVWAARRVKGSLYALEVERIANDIQSNRFQLAGYPPLDLGKGATIEWRRDYFHNRTSALDYFRLVKPGDFATVGDAHAIWLLNRHQHLVLLAQAAEITGAASYTDTIVRHLESWWEQNPHERGINWAMPSEAAMRALSWIWVFHIVGKRFPAPFRHKLLNGIYRHGCFLANNLSIHTSPNTRLLAEAVALHAIGALFPQFPRAQRWKAHGREVVRKQMEFQVRADGSHFEQSNHMHVYAMDMFLFHLAIETDAPLWFKDRLGKMAAYLDALLGQERKAPMFGDEDGGRFFHPYATPVECYGRASLATASLLLDQRGVGTEYGFEEADVFEQAIWWLSSRLLRQLSRPRDARGGDLQFTDSGVTSASRDDLSVIFKWGGFGYGYAGHSHSDALSITARYGGEELLIDAGTFTLLEPAADREWFRSTAAHNTVRVDGMNQAHAAGPERWDNKPKVTHTDAWTASVSYNGISHKRNVNLFRAGLMIVTDEIEGPSSTGEHFIEQFWRTGLEVRMLTPSCFALGKRVRLHLQPGTSRDWEVGGEFGWRSRLYGSKEACTVVRASLRTSSLPVKVVAVIDLNGAYDEWPL